MFMDKGRYVSYGCGSVGLVCMQVGQYVCIYSDTSYGSF